MSVAGTSIVASVRSWRSQWHQRWQAADPRTRTRVQVAAFLVAIVLGYHYSLSTLVQTLNLDTPLAYIGLVPVIALGLAAIRSWPQVVEPAIYDRQVDYIIGVPLMATALAINLFLPRRLSTLFWLWRIDLLSFPFFVAGAAAILFGVRVLWRQRLAIGYLFLAWPLPYTVLLLRDLNAVTNVTLEALGALLHVVRVARPVVGSGGSVFDVVHQGRSFQLSVVTACSGVNGMVGFLLVGTAFGAIVRGPRMRKALWLVGGLLLLWLINLGRLIFIFWAGRHFGEHVAISVLHPFVGLVTFNVGIVIMLLLLHPAGLDIGGVRRTALDIGGVHPTARGTGPEAVTSNAGRPLAVPAVYSAVTIVVTVGMVLGVNNSGLRAFDLVAQANGDPKLASFLRYPASPSGWAATFATEYDFAKPFFGESSTWYRYSYSPTVGGSDLHSSLPVVADVIDTDNLSSFSAYGVEACYRFHGYTLHDVSQVRLGGGITGQALSYASSGRDAQTWSIIYWIWPVLDAKVTRYERVILYLLGGSSVSVSAPGVDSGPSVIGAARSAKVNERQLAALKGFLVDFAREVIQAQTKVPPGARLTSTPIPVGTTQAADRLPARAGADTTRVATAQP